MSFGQLVQVASSGMSSQMIRLNTIASNLSNAESVAGSEAEAYKARVPVFEQGITPFADVFSDELNATMVGVRVSSVEESREPARQEYQPNHPLADSKGMVYLSNVSMIREMTDMISASRSYQANLEVINTGKQLALDTLRMGQ